MHSCHFEIYILKIQIKKYSDRNTITYKRKGFEDAWIDADNFLVMHDLSHYVIEKTMNYENGFWGIIKSGVHPEEFLIKERREKIITSDEAWYAEHMANLVLIELSQGIFDDFNSVLEQTLKTTHPNLPIVQISTAKINSIRKFYKELIDEWTILENGEMMLLEF